MSVVESQWWIIDLPEEWEASQDDEMIVISDQDGVGEIAITTLEKEQGQVSKQELQQFSEEIEQQYGPGSAVSIGELEGSYFSYREEGDALREWYLCYDRLMVLITYICAEDNAGMDDAAVNEILETIFIKEEEQEQEQQ